jgi:ribosome-binding factor A
MNKILPFNRIDKINSMLFRELTSLISREPFERTGEIDILLSLTKVETSRDLRYAKVFFTVLPEKYRGDAKRFFNSKCQKWQRIIGKKKTFKYTPRLQFFFDKGQHNAFMVEELLNKIHNV